MNRLPYEFLSRVFTHLIDARQNGQEYNPDATQIVMHLKHHAMYSENLPYMKGNRKLIKEQKAEAALALQKAMGAVAKCLYDAEYGTASAARQAEIDALFEQLAAS